MGKRTVEMDTSYITGTLQVSVDGHLGICLHRGRPAIGAGLL